jgi:DNA polymerase alpha subunit A
MRLNTSSGNSGRKLRAGDTVAYVVCDDGTSLPATQRAYHPDLEFAKRSDLKIDTRYYLEQQVHPVVARLCDPIEGTDAARIAECLGLDASGYRQALRRVEDEEDALLGTVQESDAEKYRDCERFMFPCHQCGADIVVESIENNESKTLVLAECPKCKVSPLSNTDYVRNRLTLAIRRQISRYYEGWLICEDTACATRTRSTPLVLNRGQPVCSVCHHGILRPEITEKSIYLQFGFFKHVFDVEKAENNVDEYSRACLNRLKFDVDRVLAKSAYSEVNLSRLFQGLFPVKVTKQ